MNSLEQAKTLAIGQTLYFARPLSFEFGDFPQYTKVVLSKNFDMKKPAGFRWMEVAIVEECGCGEICEFNEFDFELGNLLTEEEYLTAFAARHKVGCDCCNGDEALFYQDDGNCAFVDSHGEIMATVKGHIMRFTVDCCPKCGRRFSAISR